MLPGECEKHDVRWSVAEQERSGCPWCKLEASEKEVVRLGHRLDKICDERDRVHSKVDDLESRLGESEKEAEAQRKCADAYFNALVAIRGALDMSDDDDHVFVLDAIEGLKSRLHQLSEDHSHCEDLLHELG